MEKADEPPDFPTRKKKVLFFIRRFNYIGQELEGRQKNLIKKMNIQLIK